MEMTADNHIAGISAIRKVVNDLMLQSNSIDKLMTNKVEDYVLLEEQPLPIRIGDRTIFVGNFTIETEQKFFQQWATIISMLAGRICNWNLSTERKKELLEKADFHMLAQGKWMYEFILRDKWFTKQLIKLICNTLLKQQAYYLNADYQREKLTWKNCSYSYFKKHITHEKLIEICFLIYTYNFDATKKNARLVLEKMGLSDLTETYMPFYLSNMAGVHGKFLAARAPSLDSVFADRLKG